jgi:endoglucanase
VSRLTFIVGVFFLFGSSLVRAQTPSALDTAPGASGGTNAVPTTSAPPPPAIPAGTSLIPGGGFVSIPADPNWPDGADGAPDEVASLAENGTSFLHFVASLADQQVQFYRVIDLPPGVTGIEIAVRYRVANLKKGTFPEDDARAILEFLDAGRKPVGAAPPLIFAADASAWTMIRERFVAPAGAVHLTIMPCLFRVDTGTLDVAEVNVTTLSETDSATVAAEAAAAAAKKLAEQTAILDQEIAAPSKSAEIKTSGNRLVTADGGDVLLQGVNIGNLSIRPDEEHKILWSAHVALTDWHANIIRLPVLDSFWFGKGHGATTSNDAEAYRAIVDNVIKIAAGKGAYVLFDLHRYLAPDASCVDFWKEAAARYKNNPAVLFDILNEPHDTSWDVWRNGGAVHLKGKNPGVMQSVGMQALVDTVRGTGAQNVIVAGGLSYAFDLSGVVNGYALDDKGGHGIMYATHFYNWHGNWAKHILGTAAKYPVLVGEFGADINKMNFIPANKQEDPYTWVPDAIGFIQANHLNWTAWCFHTRATPDLLLDWDYDTPTPFWGAFAKEALSGKQFEMKKER